VIYEQTEEEDKMPKILFSKLSPPIFVDSRKKARGYIEKQVIFGIVC